jgi:hypothetical protein
MTLAPASRPIILPTSKGRKDMKKTRRALLLLLALAGAAAGTSSATAATPLDSMTQGMLAVDLGDLGAAERVFANLVADPGVSERARAEAQVRLGVVQRALGKTQASATAFQRAIESRARDAEVTRLLALALAGVAPDPRIWAREWPKLRFTSQSGPAGPRPSIRWPGAPPQGVRAAFPATDLVTFDLEDVPLNAFLHHFLVEWRPGVRSARTWPGPRAEPGYGFEAWPEPYEPPAAIRRLDFVIHSGVKGQLAGGSTDALGLRVTVKVSGTPWNELFESVLASNGLGFAIEDNLLFIARTEDLAAFDRVRGRRYSGFPISLNFLDGQLRDIFRLFVDITGFQIVPDEDLPGSLTIVVTERPAMEVLDLLLAANDLAATRIDAPEAEPATTTLRIRRLADVRGDAVDLSQLQPTRGPTDPAAAVFSVTPARFVSLEGTVQVKKQGAREWTPARPDLQLDPGDLVRSGPGASAKIRWPDGTSFHLKGDSLITIDTGRNRHWVISNLVPNGRKE